MTQKIRPKMRLDEPTIETVYVPAAEFKVENYDLDANHVRAHKMKKDGAEVWAVQVVPKTKTVAPGLDALIGKAVAEVFPNGIPTPELPPEAPVFGA